MANKTTVISLRQIETFRPATTARWLREYLHTSQSERRVDNYLAHIRLVRLIYYYFTDKEINPADYRDDLIHIYKVRDWSPYMMVAFIDLKDIFRPREWVLMWRKYQQRTMKNGIENFPPLIRQFFDYMVKIGDQMFEQYGQWHHGVDDIPGAVVPAPECIGGMMRC